MVWGFIIALLLVAGCCFFIMSSTNKRSGGISWVIALVLWIVLSFETNHLINTIDGRSQVADFVGTIIGSISDYTDYVDVSGTISTQEANQIALGCKCVLPTYSKYFRASDFQGKTYSDIPTIESANIDKAMSRSVWNSIGWILLTLIIGITTMIIFTEKTPVYGRGGRSRSNETPRNRRNTRYHSRRN